MQMTASADEHGLVIQPAHSKDAGTMYFCLLCPDGYGNQKRSVWVLLFLISHVLRWLEWDYPIINFGLYCNASARCAV